MLIVNLFFGFLFGALAAVMSVLMGLSFWSVVGCYILGCNVGLLASILAVLLRRPAEAPQLGQFNWAAHSH
jgi:uncharacterized oligopeptide transporter (OPT) family protein